MRSILLVEKNPQQRELLAQAMRRDIGCIVAEASGGEEAVSVLAMQDIHLAVVGELPAGETGADLAGRLQAADPSLPFLLSVPVGDRERILEAMRRGSFGYLNLPYVVEEVVIAAARALRVHKPDRRGAKVRKSDGFQGILGRSPKMEQLFAFLEQIAQDDQSTVLIHGESGTGKELVARAIHALGPRANRNLVPVNCAAIPEELLESELFGYVKGAFTGANQSKIGRIQYADGGTLFLDEIGDMKPALQAKLLRVLQEREFEPVGGVKPVSVDLRVIAATHRDLDRAVAEGSFREDLYYRLNVVPITIPPLRDRREDIRLLTEKFIQVFNRERKTPFLGFDEEAMTALTRYSWPGNVRELENLVQRMTVFHAGSKVGLAELPAKYQVRAPAALATEETAPLLDFPPEGIDFHLLVGTFEERLIMRALAAANGNKKEAARLLNLKRTTLLEKIKKKGLQ